MPVATLESDRRRYRIVDLAAAGGDLERLPVIHRILLENVLRTAGRDAADAASAILGWLASGHSDSEIPFLPGRVLMHDTTCGPALADIAGMRSTLAEAGVDPSRLNPVLPVDVSTDHSIGVDVFGVPEAGARNMERELARNAERYRFMKWATRALKGVRVHPPGTGIMHTLNLEQLATVVSAVERDGTRWAVPDTLIGTDSHTPMINGIGVLGWGVGGLEAESVLFGKPIMMRVPDVVGVRLAGELREGVLATDLALAVTERLRKVDLADKFVEFFGPGVAALSAGDRAVVANMTPEFGGNSGFFPIDARTLRYLGDTGRPPDRIQLVACYARRQGLWFDPQGTPRYSEQIDFDLGTVGASVAGPRRPQDRLPAGETAAALCLKSAERRSDAPGDGAVAIAAITSCTNTSDPRLLIAAGLLARKARRAGLKPPSWVKTSLAPGSPAAAQYLRRAGLLEDLEALGFGIVGFGCTTCIGNSGRLTDEIADAIAQRQIAPVAVLSGNRNFPGRVHPSLDAAFLASPPLVLAFALAGDVNRNIMKDPIGRTASGREIRLGDLWPTGGEIDAALAKVARPSDYAEAFARAARNEAWERLEAPSSPLFDWDEASTYIRRPPFASVGSGSRLGTYAARPLMMLGDDITTDHISPAGQVPLDSEAARYLTERGEKADDLNVFAARRANWEVMVRGLFTNRTVRNLLDSSLTPGMTRHMPSGEILSLWHAAKRYADEDVPVIVVAGERYGMGSSRDWAAKGVALLGVRAVLATSFERIHRSNLIGMGVLPLRLPAGERLNVRADDLIEVDAPADRLRPRGRVAVRIVRGTGEREECRVTAAIETSLEIDILRRGGILPYILAEAIGGHR